MTSPQDIEGNRQKVSIKEREQAESPTKDEAAAGVNIPDAPSGLIGIFTGTSVVLSWNEASGQEITSYIIYRDAGQGFVKAGETVVPAYMDEDIRMKSVYRYKVSAMGTSESDFSAVIEMLTEEK